MRFQKYLLIPFQHQGRTYDGADCFGLVRLFYQDEFGIDLPDFTEDYPKEWWREKNYFLDLYEQYHFRPVDVPELGNLIFFKNGESVGHVGIALTEGMFIHMTSAGCGIQSYQRGVFSRQLHSCYEYVAKRSKKRKP